MKSRCTICNHTLIDDINLTILSGDYTLDELSQKFGPSRSAFHRHGRHLEKKMARTLERLENHRKQVSLLKLSAFLDHVQTRVEAAVAGEDTDRVFKGSHIGCRLIHQINKMDVPLELDTAYRLLSSPDLFSRDSLLPAGPQIIADLHQALRDKTLKPCPPTEDDEDDEAAENQAENRPDLEKELLQLLAALETKSRPPKTAQAAPQNQRPLRKKLRQEKHLFQEKNLFQNFGAGQECEAPPAAPKTSPPANAGLPESAAPPALTNPSSLIPFPCPSNPELETAFSDPCTLTTNYCSVPPDHSPADASPPATANVGRESAAHPAVQEPTPLPCRSNPEASPPATASENQRDKSATNAKRQRRLLKKMLRNQKHIFKAKKLVQHLTVTRKNEPPAAQEETLFPPVPLEIRNSELETSNQEPETGANPWLSPELDPWLSPGIRSCPSDLGLIDPPSDYLDTGNPELETDSALKETANREPGTKPPPPYDETAARADELFEISHGYKRNNPPPIIPNRRRDEDFRSRSIFGDVKNVLKYM